MTILFAMVVFAAVAYVVYRSRKSKRKAAGDVALPVAPPPSRPRAQFPGTHEP